MIWFLLICGVIIFSILSNDKAKSHERIWNSDNNYQSYSKPGIKHAKVDIIKEAISEGKDVVFTYTKTDYSTKETQRRVTPYRVYTQERRTYFEGYCHLRKENRTFRISRI